MIRSIFLSVGLFVTLWGVSLLFVDKVVLNSKEEGGRDRDFRGLFTSVNADRQKVFDPPDWCAFSLMSVGSVTMLYAVALPRKG
jgi:hypothetical protein